MKYADLQKKSEAELMQVVTDARKSINETRRALQLGEVKDVKKIANLKKDIARSMTLMNQKALTKEASK